MQRNRDAHTRPALGAVIAAGLALGLGGCIGGGDGGGNDVAGGGMSGTGITYGPVDAFGSIFVNGKRYDTEDAEIVLDGRASELERGMLVRVEWESDGSDRKANRVEFDSQVIGPVETFDTMNETFTVLGQEVRYSQRTRFNECASGLPSGADVVQVSGWTVDDEGGVFRASYVQCLERDDEDYEIEGRISDLEADARTFRLGSLIVDYGNARIDDDITDEGGLSDGAYVEVEGTFDVDRQVFFAAEIDEGDDDRLRGRDDDDVEFQGTITEMNPDNEPTTFRINGITVEVDRRTEYDDGLTEFSDLRAGLLVSVEGHYVGDRRVRAEEIEVGDGEVELEASIEGTPTASHDYFVIGGIDVRITEATIVVDDDEKRIRVDELRQGEWVEVEGTRRTANDGEIYLEAILIEREDDEDDEFEYEGPLEAIDVNGKSITIINLKIDYDCAGLETEFDDTNPVDLENRLRNGLVVVEVEYVRVNGSQYCAEEIELEDD